MGTEHDRDFDPTVENGSLQIGGSGLHSCDIQVQLKAAQALSRVASL